MSSKFYLLFFLIISTAARHPVRIKEPQRLCSSIVDCQACLLIPQCYAVFRPLFECNMYPVHPDFDENSTIIVEETQCCPRSYEFDATLCGFHRNVSNPDTTLSKWNNWGYIVAASAAAIIIVVLAAALAITACARRCKKARITDISPGSNVRSTSDLPPPPPMLPTDAHSQRVPQTSTGRIPAVMKQSQPSPASSFQDEMKHVSSASWNLRRSTMKGHPLDQSRE